VEDQVATHDIKETRGQPSILTFWGGANALFVHLGGLHRLHELGCLKGLEIRVSEANPPFTLNEEKILADWNNRAKSDIGIGESFAEAFGAPLRTCRQKRSWVRRWWSGAAPTAELEGCGAKLCLSPENDVSWNVKDIPRNDRELLHISEERHEELKKLALSPQFLPELAIDYLIDWGYWLCDASLREKSIGVSQIPFASPNRLFYALPKASFRSRAGIDKAPDSGRTDEKTAA
jgi:hypothetical protein